MRLMGSVEGPQAHQQIATQTALRTYLRLIWHEWQTTSTRLATKLSMALQQFLSDPSAVLRGFPQVSMAHERPTA